MRFAWPILLLLGTGGLPHAHAGEGSLVARRLLEHRGQIVVVNFWAAWCGPCQSELPLLATLHREFEGRGVQFIGASTDGVGQREAAVDLLERSGVRYPILFGLSEANMREVGLGSLLPATAVFDRDGTRVFRLVGEVTRKRLVERLEWLLGDRVRRPPRELQLPPGIDAADYPP